MLSRKKQAAKGSVIAGIVLLASVLITAGSWAAVALAQLDLSVFQKEATSEEQKSKDRYECHRLAILRTEFDPGVRPPDDTPPGLSREEKAEFKAQQSVEWRKGQVKYNEALSSCMEKRGYTMVDH
jgi:hypothetical protein